MFGIATENDIVWADTEKHVVYYLHSDDVAEEEQLKVALNVVENP